MSKKQDKPIVLLLSGPAGSGKTTLGGSIKAALDKLGIPNARTSFAQSLKDSVSASEMDFGLSRTDWNDYAAKDAARPLLVELGRHLRKRDKDVFVSYLHDKLLNRAAQHGVEVVIVEDWRYLNEYNYLAARVATVFPLRLHRCSVTPCNDEEAASLSEIDRVFLELPGCMDVGEWFSPEDREDKAHAIADYVAAVWRSRQPPADFVGEASS